MSPENIFKKMNVLPFKTKTKPTSSFAKTELQESDLLSYLEQLTKIDA